MADKDGLHYRPNIATPSRTNETGSDDEVRNLEAAYDELRNRWVRPADEDRLEGAASDRLEQLAYVSRELDTYLARAMEAKRLSVVLRDRARLLQQMAIDSLNPYLGDAPAAVLSSYTYLTGRRFVDQTGAVLPASDPVYLPSRETVRCIFRVAGYGNPDAQMADINNAVRNWDSEQFRQTYYAKTKYLSAAKMAVYALSLLWLTIKMCMVVAVHYTVGYVCHWLKQFDFSFRIPVIKKKIKIKIGSALAKVSFAPVEKAVLWIFGYRCLHEGEPAPDCDSEAWTKMDFSKVTCCTNKPVFFREDDAYGDPSQVTVDNSDSGYESSESTPKNQSALGNGTVVYTMSACFERWIRTELDPEYTGARTICSYANESDESIEPSEQEVASARMVADYLMVANNNATSNGVMHPIDITTTQNAIRYTNMTTEMATSMESAINSNKEYVKTGNRSASWDCFGYTSETTEYPSYVSSQGTASSSLTDQPVVVNSYFTDVLKNFDEALYKVLELADKVVSRAAALSLWGSSRFFCCWVYLIVMIGTIWNTMIKKRRWCPKMECTSEDEYNNYECADAIRRELMFASRLKDSAALQDTLSLLKILKDIVDIFINRKNLTIYIEGLRLPLHDMWEEMKIIITTNLSQFLDILFGPLDAILSGLRATPEIRNMINNNCFGFGSFLDWLACLLGNLKASIMEFILKLLAFQLQDLTIINDTYLCRTRLKSLEALSKLLGLMIGLLLGLRDCYEPETLAQKILEKEAEDQYNRMQDFVALAGSAERARAVAEAAQRIVPDYDTGEIPSTDFTPEEIRLAERDGILNRGFDAFNALDEPYDDLLRIFQNEQGYNVSSAVELVNVFIKEDGSLLTLPEFVLEVERISGVTMGEIMESMGERIFETMRG